MKLYLIASFPVDNTIKDNPPLSEEGIRQAKSLRLTLPKVKFDYCFSSFSICDYGSAMLVVGDKLVIDRDSRLESVSKKVIEQNIREFLNYLAKTFQDKNVLVVVDKPVFQVIKKNMPSAIIL